MGFQSPGTLGRNLLDGVDSVKLFGEDVAVRAKIVNFPGLSSHADHDHLVDWIKHFDPAKTTHVFVVHGDREVAPVYAETVKGLGFAAHAPQYTEEWLYQDENGEFPYAKKLVELAKYYGFDGYFINQEASIDSSYVPLFREMLQYMREQGIYIQWYDSIVDNGSISYQNAFNNRNSGWIWNETNGRVTDSIFLNLSLIHI